MAASWKAEPGDRKLRATRAAEGLEGQPRQLAKRKQNELSGGVRELPQWLRACLASDRL